MGRPALHQDSDIHQILAWKSEVIQTPFENLLDGNWTLCCANYLA